MHGGGLEKGGFRGEVRHLASLAKAAQIQK
jgi:hypothetical protein